MPKFAAMYVLALAASVLGEPPKEARGLRAPFGCTGIINSLVSVSTAEGYNMIEIHGFTVPAGKKLVINPAPNTIINLMGNLVFEADTSFQTGGPLFMISGNGVTFNGNDYTIDGQGAKYWDGLGTATNERRKPHPMILLNFSGTFQHVRVLNSPAHAFGVTNKATLTISHVTIDNSLGNLPNLLSGLKPAGHNTDGFNVLANDVTIKDSVVINQDDCIAIASGNNINILRNKCVGGHGISIGSIITGRAVSNVLIAGNYLVSSEQALRIKTFAGATSGLVRDITYTDNQAFGCFRFGVIIDQSYPTVLGTPRGSVKIQGVTFTGTNVITVLPRAAMVEVNCVPGDCSGTWDWAGLKVYGGRIGTHMYSGIINFRQ